MSPQSETPVTATMSGAKFSQRYEEKFFYIYVIFIVPVKTKLQA